MTPSQRIGVQIARKLATVTHQTIVKKGNNALADTAFYNKLIEHLGYLTRLELEKSYPASIVDPHSELHWRWQLLPEKTNLIHGYPMWSIALLLFKDHQPETAVLINAADGSEYLAASGHGALFGNQRIRVNPNKIPGLLYAGDRELPGNQRDNGSPMLSIGLMARGSLHAVCYGQLTPFEIAFSHLMIQEAGGRCCDFSGNEGRGTSELLAAESKMLRKLLLTLFNAKI